MNLKKRLLFIFTILIISSQFFQNCSSANSFQSLEMINSSNATSPSHSSDDVVSAPSQKDLYLSRTQIEEMFISIFLLESSPQEHINFADSLLLNSIKGKPAQFGQPCDPYSSYTGQDCNNSDISTTAAPYYPDGNTVSESFRSKACIDFVSNNTFFTNALINAGVNYSQEPTVSNYTAIYNLFYRAETMNDDVFKALYNLNSTLKISGVNLIERYRALLLQVCESPGWMSL